MSVPQLSDVGALEGGLSIRSLASVLGDDTNVHELLLSDDAGAGPMFALNSALMADGVVIDIAKDTSPAKPLHIVHIASGNDANRLFIENSRGHGELIVRDILHRNRTV